MNEITKIQTFQNSQFGEVRVTQNEKGEPLFCLADVCAILDLRQGDVRQRLDDGVVLTQPILDSLGRTQQANFVNEDGLYDTILDSRKPEAKYFRKWVTSEVLPSIRKHGAYMTQKAMEPEEILLQSVQLMIEQKKRINQIEKKVMEIDQRTMSRPDYYTVVGYASKNGMKITLRQACSLGKKATAKCKKQGLVIDSMPDPRFGIVNLYPTTILDQLFDTPIN